MLGEVVNILGDLPERYFVLASWAAARSGGCVRGLCLLDLLLGEGEVKSETDSGP